MRALVFTAALAVGLMACGGMTGPDEIRPVGSFNLVSVDGRPLPALSNAQGDQLLSRIITLRSDGTYADRRRVRISGRSGSTEDATISFGSWVGAADLIRIVPDGEEEAFDAWVLGAMLEMKEDDLLLRFRVQPGHMERGVELGPVGEWLPN